MLPGNKIISYLSYLMKRKLIKTFDIGYKKMDACINDCCLLIKRNNKWNHVHNVENRDEKLI